MKKIIVMCIFAMTSCSAAPTFAEYDKAKCEWSMTADQTQVESQIRKDVISIVNKTNPGSIKAVDSAISKDGNAINYNYVLYCDKTFKNSDIVKEILG